MPIIENIHFELNKAYVDIVLFKLEIDYFKQQYENIREEVALYKLMMENPNPSEEM